MTMGIRVLVAVIIVMLGALMTFWFLDNFEQVEVSSTKQISAEARQNPFLAAEKFLNVMGTPATSVSGRSQLYNLPNIDDTLVINDYGEPLNPERFDALLAWIAEGGHLVMDADDIWDEETQSSGNQLLDHYGIRLEWVNGVEEVETDDSDTSDGEIQESSEQDYIDGLEDIVIEFSSDEQATATFPGWVTLRDPNDAAHAAVSGIAGVHLLQIEHGEGMITLFTDLGFMKNPGSSADLGDISQQDNAYLLWVLVGGEGMVWLVYRGEFPSLAALLWKHAPEFCLSAIVLLIIWMWWLRNPFGPRHLIETDGRRNVLEQMNMTTNFEWRIDQGITRLQRSRKQLLDIAQKRWPKLASLTDQQKASTIAANLDLPEEAVQNALFGGSRGERGFLVITKQLQRIWQKL